MNGYLLPMAGGDPIPLLKERILVGRRPDCDIRLEQSNVSGKHCELRFERGGWVVKDLASTNGVRVNGVRIENRKRLMPGDEVVFARKHFYKIQFDLEGNLEAMLAETKQEEEQDDNIMSRPLLERAGLQRAPIKVAFDSDVFEEENGKTTAQDSTFEGKRRKLG